MFTYEKPDEEVFFSTLMKYLEKTKEDKLVKLLKGGKCSIRSDREFSGQRWNAKWTEVAFYILIDNLDLVDKELNKKLISVCHRLIPAEAGFDVMSVDFLPNLEIYSVEKSMIEDLDDTVNQLSNSIEELLPSDVKEKGKEMAEAYIYLYSVENSIRFFIEKVCQETYGVDYFSMINLNKSIKDSIDIRKKQEEKNKWIRVRANSELFYLDFKELGMILSNNWTLFSKYFPDQNWIITKINEMAECRNLVAHNSYVGRHEKDVVRVNFNSILRQINQIH
ncbi:Swt1 family HEPN domain-containing protein [Paenibacillus sp. FSL R5-0914]|uniref:Swt1 family HEPN domain-containing protein n=1 Tax=Paenibacillus sp. FSL R5-0914 TaxID=2921665 RepID=UPI0030FC063C